MRKVMLILRFPHNFGVLGCWGRSSSIHFAIFRALGRSWTGSGSVGAESCPILGGSRIFASRLCTSSRASHCTNHSKIASERCYDVFMLSLHFCFSDFFHSEIIFSMIFTKTVKLSDIMYQMITYHQYRLQYRVICERSCEENQKNIIFEMKKSKIRKCSDNINTS